MSKGKSERTPRSKGGIIYLQVRIADAEKAAFDEASQLAGLSMSAWVRERLRAKAREELLSYGKIVPFLKKNGK